MKLGTLSLSLVVAALTLSAGCASEVNETGQDQDLTQKPVQFVMLAFDGSKNNAFWQESRDFAKTVKKADGSQAVKFTYFVNPSYYLPDASKSKYCGPMGCGKSAIGFGGTEADVTARIRQTAAAAKEGHAIESHAVGHFDGSTWSAAQWSTEFNEFDRLFFTNPDGSARAGLEAIKSSGMVGFRAPQLGHSPGLFEVLKAKGFTYDTSKINQANYWPEKNNAVWNFPLATLVLKNSGKRTLSMDYNHFMAHSKAVSDSANAAKYRKDVIDTYMGYFNANYAGNRAPIHIGHHFSKWNGGAYWLAMKDFAIAVCSKPDVKCGTYRELVSFMEALPAGKRAELQAGNFGDSAEDCPATEPACQGESEAAHNEDSE
jgi:hypothetical protein